MSFLGGKATGLVMDKPMCLQVSVVINTLDNFNFLCLLRSKIMFHINPWSHRPFPTPSDFI